MHTQGHDAVDSEPEPRIGVIVVDHGSRRELSNTLLEEVAELLGRLQGYDIVEPAHMELARPSIAEAFDACVARGAETVVVLPFFLLPGRHWTEDIPRLAADAAKAHPGVRHLVTAPLGLHPLLTEVMHDRIDHCLACAHGIAEPCDLCVDRGPCQFAAGKTFRKETSEKGI
jgi:sirohydrochlorin ferrochelatase